MANKIKLELTEAQFNSMIDVIDTISAMIGCGADFAIAQNKNVRLLDRMLKQNGFKRKNN